MHTTCIILHETADMSADVYNIYIYILHAYISYILYIRTGKNKVAVKGLLPECLTSEKQKVHLMSTCVR